MLDGYSLQTELHRGRKHVVCRALCEAENASVIIKSINVGAPSTHDTDDLTREFEILSDLNIDGVVRARELAARAGTMHLILEDTGGIALAEHLRSAQLDLAARLQLAIGVTTVLRELHANRVVHKDINPANILVDPADGKITLIDFSISTRLAEEHQPVSHPNVLEGTLAYLSPEQTGRMNRPIDYRSDFYSLGVTLFELLTEQLPFQARDPMELLHCHLAIPAPDPTEFRQGLPASICAVIRKLLEKAPEDRYQSATGILADLRACLEHVRSESIPPDFHPGQSDVKDRFSIPKKLYGRSKELETLMQAFERVSRHGAELLLVSGYSGIGKSTLIHAVHGPITARQGYFAAGKYDQLQRTVPYSAIVVALRDLIRQVLTESEDSLQDWRRKLQDAVGDNGQLVIDVIPELQHVIGPQKAVPELGTEQARDRFRTVFQSFIRVFCRQESCLVIFLDDLQWADPASLHLIGSILSDGDIEHLLVVGAYRDNEVGDSHPLAATLDALKADDATVSEVSLGPLSSTDVSRLLTDTLHRSADEIRDLHLHVVEKTGGNPFFLGQFLKTLHHRRGLVFHRESNRWVWDMAAIEAMNITDNVIDLMVVRLRALPEATQEALRIAACVGSTFDLGTLGAVMSRTGKALLTVLAPALEAGLVLPLKAIGVGEGNRGDGTRGPALRFLHDRVQQAAYSLIDESPRRQAHLLIGQRLLARLPTEDRAERLFEIVDHLNIGGKLISDDAERRRLAELNLEAARKGIDAVAYDAAAEYAAAGLQCLSDDRWDQDYELTKKLRRAEYEAEYLRGHFERSQEIIDATFVELHTPTEQAELLDALIIQHTLCGRYAEAVETGRRGLALLGIELPTRDLDAALEHELARYREALGTRQPKDLLELPEMSSPEKRVAMRLLGSVCPLCYIACPALCRVVSAMMVNLSLVHGHTSTSALGYSFFGLTHVSTLRDYHNAYELGRLAISLADNFQDSPQVCRTSHVFCAFINHWTRPLREFDAINRQAFETGLLCGEHQFAGYHRYNRALCRFHQAVPLEELLSETEEWMRFGHRSRNEHVTDNIHAVRRVAMDLAGHTPEFGSFTMEHDDTSFAEDLAARNAKPAMCHYHIMKSQALYLYGALDEARRCSESAAETLSFVSGHISVAVHNFYDSLILAAAAKSDAAADPLERIEHNQIRMREWAESCPENFLHKRLLVDAEVARLEGDEWRAAVLYDQAIAEADRGGYLQEEALARERAGLFWLSRGLRKIAALYLREAHHAYRVWGAARKAELLASQHVELLTGSPELASSSGDTSVPFFTLVSSSGAALDFATVMKASRTISNEIDLDSLVRRLVRIAVETAGAQHGRLLLAQKGGLHIEATSTVEQGETRCSPPISVESSGDVPQRIVNYVTRTKQTLTVADAVGDARFASDPVIEQRRPRSILCLPITMQTEVLGLLYLEHNLVTNAFTSDRVQILQSLAAQAAISLQNARLYEKQRESERQLREALSEVQELKNRLEAENLYFREEIETHHKFEEIVGRSSGITKLLKAVETVAPTDATVMILGETGTGKELVARAIHAWSACKGKPLINVNCAALPSGLIESELFGHERGAFTGAVSSKTGRFELADGGTIFLDEIGDLPADLQAKLLRVLQEGEFEKVGGSRTIRVTVRVIAATNRDLVEAMKSGHFREDLYYRLNVFPLHIPPLRDRRGDISLLVQHFVLKHGAKLGKRVESIPQRHMDTLQGYHWPGNVRELENVIERAVILTQGPEFELGGWSGRVGAPAPPIEASTLEEVEREHILRILKRTNWKLGGNDGAAQVLGLKRTTLQGRMRKLKIRRDT